VVGLHKCFADLWVPFENHWVHCDVYFGFVDGLKCFFIEPHSQQKFFYRGIIYGHNDDGQRFAFFCRAAMEFLLKSHKRPDVIHCHDWQTALIPVLLYEIYQKLWDWQPRVCFTLHNLGHQGIHGGNALWQVGLNPERLMTPDRLLDDHRHGALNLMKGGIVYANYVTTVSPRYALEIRNTHLGMGLQRILNVHRKKFGGILNGIDYNVWNPEVDPHIPHRYNIASLQRKYANKEALRNRLWLRQDFKPILAFVGRLDHQKGVELIFRAVSYSIENGCQFVLLGSSPHGHINEVFWRLKRQYNDNPDCHLEIGYDEELAHLIYAGSDMILVPSEYEPCGLTQLIGLKYGTVPVVRNTGGLADTVVDAEFTHKPYHERNGYVFNDYSWSGLESALRRAIGLWRDYPHFFRELMVNGMRCDYSWNQPGGKYLDVYNHINTLK
jgi:starch synthase